MQVLGKRTIAAGVLFFTGTLSGILSAVLPAAVSGNTAVLAAVSSSGLKLRPGMVFVLLMGLSIALVPMLLYPQFRRQHPTLALGAAILCGPLQAVLCAVTGAAWLLLIAAGMLTPRAAGAGYLALLSLLAMLSAALRPLTGVTFGFGLLMLFLLVFRRSAGSDRV